MSEKRKLCAIVFADIAGYTAMMQKDEELGLFHQSRFKEILEKHVKFYHTRNSRKILENKRRETAHWDCVCGKTFINNTTKKTKKYLKHSKKFKQKVC